jgi:hypothetical protein
VGEKLKRRGEEQPEKALLPIRVRLDSGSNTNDDREVQLEKQCLQRSWTDAGMQIDFSEMH